MVMMAVMVMERYEGRKGVARANQTGAAKVTKPCDPGYYGCP